MKTFDEFFGVIIIGTWILVDTSFLPIEIRTVHVLVRLEISTVTIISKKRKTNKGGKVHTRHSRSKYGSVGSCL